MLPYDIKSYDSDRTYLPYPPDTKAFLYYSTSPKNPRIAGELRFRVASGDDLASFESGSDLLLTNGRLWTRPLIAISKFYILLYEKLKEELLVPDDLDAVLSTLPKRNFRYGGQSQYLYTLNDTFIVFFGNYEQYLTVITEQGLESMPFRGPFSEFYERQSMPPYTGAYTNRHLSILYDFNESVGSALVRFERSTLPKHNGTRTVVLRFLKIITPAKPVNPLYAGKIVPPKEGELHQKHPAYHTDADVEVWSLNIDKKHRMSMGRGLQLLWDVTV
jgi:hypothetical protein